MRIDHHAYQRATRVAGVGFLVQLGIGLTLLVFALIANDTAFLFGSIFVLLGILAWLGLIVIFNQHKLERLEALEEDELAVTRGGRVGSAFEAADDEIRVAARRLKLMHKWLMPGLSLFIAAVLGVLAWRLVVYMMEVADTSAEFVRTDHIGWAIAICLGFTAVSFILSRFVAGMAKQEAWRNLRGGAAWMVGNSLVCLAIAVGQSFRFFKNDHVVEIIAIAIAILMAFLAAEIILNFILNIYRPRIVGETPRPAFDSKVLSLFAAPDNLVRAVNEAVNYQFGFDVTSSWGYQLMLRSTTWLLVLGALALMVLNMMVIVEPHQQAVKLSHGRIVGEPHTSGIMWKLPWPFQTAEVHDVSTIRQMHLTARHTRDTTGPGIQLWTDDLEKEYDRKPDPFLVGGAVAEVVDPLLAAGDGSGEPLEAAPVDGGRFGDAISLVDAEIVLQYRVRADGGLMDYISFSPEPLTRRRRVMANDEAFRRVALREITQYLSTLSLDDVLAGRRDELGDEMRRRVQGAFDDADAGIEVVAVNLPMIRPSGDAARDFEDLSISNQQRLEFIALSEQQVIEGYTELLGDAEHLDAILQGIDEYERLKEELGADAAEAIAQRVRVEQIMSAANGEAGRLIAEAEARRWVAIMDARAEASRIRGQLAAYRASPELYRQRETMRVYKTMLAGLRKYVVGIDPARVNFDIDLKELNPLFNISDVVGDAEGGSTP